MRGKFALKESSKLKIFGEEFVAFKMLGRDAMWIGRPITDALYVGV